jgi:hypothetical protein
MPREVAESMRRLDSATSRGMTGCGTAWRGVARHGGGCVPRFVPQYDAGIAIVGGRMARRPDARLGVVHVPRTAASRDSSLPSARPRQPMLVGMRFVGVGFSLGTLVKSGFAERVFALRTGWHRTSVHPPVSPPDQRQSRTLHPDLPAGMGLCSYLAGQ